MKLIAKNDNQLGTCLKMLYNEGLTELPVELDKDENGKIYFKVILTIDETLFKTIEDKYDMLIAE